MKKTTKKIIASALAATMVMASSAMVFADVTGDAAQTTTDAATTATSDATTATSDAAKATYEELTKCSYSTQMRIADGCAYVDVLVDGDVSAFDFGFMYKADEVEYDTYELNADFDKAFAKKAQGILAVNDQKDQSYVVAGGTSDECTFKGVAFTITFKLKDGVTAPAISVVKDSKAFLDAYNAASATGTLADFVATKPFEGDAPEATVVEVPATETPATETPATEAPATSAPAAAPATSAPAPTSPKTGDAGVVLPIVAICGAAAAVAVASKKKVED